MFRTTRRPRYADVVATLALVLALGGTTAYAVQSLPKHSVGKKQLKKDAVTSSRIKNGKVKGKDLADASVTNTKIANGTIVTGDLAEGAVNGAKIANGTVGLDDLAGGTGTSTVSYSSLAPDKCQAVVVPVAGATVSQFAVIGLANADNADGVAFTPARASAGTVSSRLCNLSADPVTGSLVIRAITFG